MAFDSLRLNERDCGPGTSSAPDVSDSDIDHDRLIGYVREVSGDDRRCVCIPPGRAQATESA